MNSRYKVIDVEVENWTSQKRKQTSLAYGGFSMYIRCQSAEEALSIPKKIEISGHQIKLYHSGCKTCETCGKQGHATREHEAIHRESKKTNKNDEQQRKERKEDN